MTFIKEQITANYLLLQMHEQKKKKNALLKTIQKQNKH